VAVENRMKMLLGQGVSSNIRQELKGNLKRPNFSAIVRAARSGDRSGIRILEESGVYLGIALANVVNLLNPGLIIVGGLVAEAGGLILEPLKSTFKKYALSKPAGEVDILLTELDEWAGALGATTLVLENFFAMP